MKMSSGKEWPCGGAASGGGNAATGNAPPVEEWSVHAQLTFTPQAGNIVLTTHDGSSQQHQHRCTADSGYSSERVMSPRSCISGNMGPGTALTGTRATCSVTVAGHHTVTLTCAEVPFDSSPLAVPPQAPPVLQQHVCQHQQDTSKPPPGPPPGYQPQFHHHPPTHTSVQPPRQTPPPPPPPPANIPAYRDAASQTSTTQVPQVVQTQLNKPKSSRPLVRSPARVKARSPIANKSTASSSDGKKQPRTVHIDVYCTGSESNGSTSSEEETTSTPQTVFESSKAKIVHTRANSDSLPHALMKQKRRVLSNSTIDGSTLGATGASGSTISTSYPSPRSSLVSHRSLASGSTVSSLQTTTTNHSSTATSWKDTDLESTRSLLKCDSFEYENSFDKLRIREKEKLWAGPASRSKQANVSKDGGDDDDDDDDSSSSSSDDSEEGLAWSFGHEEVSKQSNIRRENTVRRTSNTTDNLIKLPPPIKKSGSLSDSEASTSLRYKRESARKMPYSPPSIFEHNIKAARFGPTVGSLRRPGHHIGPSKNPDCSCDTCKYYFEHVCYRNRTRSLGDRPLES